MPVDFQSHRDGDPNNNNVFRMKHMKKFLLAAACGLALSTTAQAAAINYCVYDPVGAQGQAFGLARDYALAAKTWGVTLNLRPYTEERVAAEDFKAGQCDIVGITGLRARQFNAFVGSIDSIGSITSYKELRAVIQMLANPRTANTMVKGDYEVVGIVPLGAAYVFVRDRSIDSIEKAAGKKIAVLDFDKSQARMVQQLGAQPVASDITNFATRFNNGQVDIIAAPGIAYKPFELYKGLGSTGAVYRFPLAQLTANIVIRRGKFPADFGVKSRQYVVSQLDMAERLIAQAEKDIDAKYWMDLTPADKEKYTQMMREARIQMTKEGFYDPKMMSLLKRIRCQVDGKRAECAEPTET